MLTIESLQAGYGHTPVLFDVSLSIASGEVVTLLGRNGMGKTTTIRTLMGLLPAAGGSMRFREHDLGSLAAEDRARLGLGLVPEGRQVFPTLSVVENLIATAANRRGVEFAVDTAAHLGALPAARGTPAPNRLDAVGRRAADAGDRPGVDDEPAAADPR